MDSIDLQAEYDASTNYAVATASYQATQGWFGCDSLCQRNKERMEMEHNRLQQVRKQGLDTMSRAKSVVGLYSELGVEEVKASFWEYFYSGKQFGKRQSMWDALFVGIGSMARDEGFVEYVLRVLMQVLINFTAGLAMALIFFIFGLWNLIASYQPDPITAVAFFIGASCAAFAFVVTYWLIICGAAGGAVYGASKLAESRLRIQAKERPLHHIPHHQQQQQQQQHELPLYHLHQQ